MGLPSRADVVVIGAGQAGLSVAYYLQRLGLRPGSDLLVVDRGPRPGGAWQHRWEALRLGSAHRVNDLPGMRRVGLSFETADRARAAGDVVAEYYERYEQFYGLDVRRPVIVSAVYDREAEMVVRTQAEEVVARIVVNATGTWGAPFVPYYPGIDRFQGRQVHTATYVSAAEFAGQRVLVVGGGTSAIGFLLEMEGVAARTLWVTRRPVDYLPQGELGPEAGIAAVADQDAAAREGRALPSIVSGTGVPKTRRIAAAMERGVLDAVPPFVRLEQHEAVWANGHREHIDAIIWATGFRPDIRHLSPLRLHEKAGGITVSTGAAARDPRIFFAGYGPTASTIGANRAGRTLARQIFGALGGTGAAGAEPGTATASLPVTGQQDHVADLMARFFTDA